MTDTKQVRSSLINYEVTHEHLVLFTDADMLQEYFAKIGLFQQEYSTTNLRLCEIFI